MENIVENTGGTVSRLIGRVLMTETIILAIACLTSALLTSGVNTALSVAIGAIISTLSFGVLALVIYKSMTGEGRAVILITLLGTIKVMVLGVLLWWLISHGVAEPIPFMIGFGTMVLTLIIESMRFKRE